MMLSTVETENLSWNAIQGDARLGVERSECYWNLLYGQHIHCYLHTRSHDGVSRSAEDGVLIGGTFKSMADWVVGV